MKATSPAEARSTTRMAGWRSSRSVRDPRSASAPLWRDCDARSPPGAQVLRRRPPVRQDVTLADERRIIGGTVGVIVDARSRSWSTWQQSARQSQTVARRRHWRKADGGWPVLLIRRRIRRSRREGVTIMNVNFPNREPIVVRDHELRIVGHSPVYADVEISAGDRIGAGHVIARIDPTQLRRRCQLRTSLACPRRCREVPDETGRLELQLG